MTRTPAATVTHPWLWRWRRNPLKRHSDVVEAWIVLVTWVLATFAAVVAGVVTAGAAGQGFSARAAGVHSVSAVLTDDAAKPPATGSGSRDGREWATVRWTDAHGSVHTDQARVFPGAPAGTRVTVWTDRANRVVPAPITGAAATGEAVGTGVLVAGLAGTAVLVAGRAVRGGLLRRRLAEWDKEWNQVGPRWGNLNSGGT
ncbi:hypothetical protein LK07_01200 [Streptomyces pluripotens]|uniref:Uncharacterized protein n=1 Tax=Streptomyces pluripotens TaxID=1355015 RepID=A0A221NSI4_9ACTN|nr:MULTISPECIES: hypothetical protein [Streptomyces]ARP68612.1 hypothetical protein LK06_000120 [Streptomyces pluripotens]ASN22872.1 hypothetical protein LK07_01200 [Streptomyces pluripotens]KIE23311.1 membrane protein [Streptomyces sp. MUSC 125]MCH0558274.1 hypothetical protein [Streptomyces sp. MUM 16J]